jgi:lipopolysaccharide transport system ATP-binding protein
MSDPVISVENLSKRYLVGHQFEQRKRDTTLRDTITREVSNFGRKAIDLVRGRQIIQGDQIEEFWALNNVSFEVKKGEVIAIIGRNGAGKSTLLKILSRITEPTKGRVALRGRVASLLEVGTGFHQELTGRENIFLNGAILGMTKKEISNKFDEIVAFADVEKFLDTPVKRYSSGMYVRLAFAVAAHLEPEILLVDEVLAVGDAEFQRKCIGRMDQISREGRTVLFVSHNMGAVTTLCPSTIWLENGSVYRHGTTRAVVAEYLSDRMPDHNRVLKLDDLPRPSFVQEDRLRLQQLEWVCNQPLQHGEALKARIQLNVRARVEDATIGIGFSSVGGQRLLTYETDFPDGFRPALSPGSYLVDVEVEKLPLAPDNYQLSIGCRSGDRHPLDYVEVSAPIEVIPGPGTPGYVNVPGAGVRLESKWIWNNYSIIQA